MSNSNNHSSPESNEGSQSDYGSFGKSKVPKVVEQFRKSESVHKRTLNKRVKLKDVKFDVEQENPDALIKQIEQKQIKKRQSVPSFKEWRATTTMNLQKSVSDPVNPDIPTITNQQQNNRTNRLSSPMIRKNETMRDLRSSSTPAPPTQTTLTTAATLQRKATMRREMTRKQFENWPQNYNKKAQSITPTLSSSPKLSRTPANSPNYANNTDTSTNSPLPPTPTSSSSESLPSLPLSKNSSVNASLPSIPTSPITPFVSPTRSQSNIPRPTDLSTLSPGPLSSSNVEDPRKVQTPPSNVHKIQIPLPEVLDSRGSLDVAIVQAADNNITSDNNILNGTMEPEDVPQEEVEDEPVESDDDESLDHILLPPLPTITNMTDIKQLKEILEAEKQRHRNTREKVKQQKEKVKQTKQGMRSLLGQLSGYKKVVEDEHGEIQAELDSVTMELEELNEIKENLLKQENLYKEEITDLQQEIAQRKEEYVQELLAVTGNRKTGERETLNSMRTYIDELNNLEQVNETLNEGLAQNCALLEKERDDHMDTLRLLDTLRARIKQDLSDMEEIKLTNEVLLNQIKAMSHSNAGSEPKLSLNLSRVASFDTSVNVDPVSTISSRDTTPDPSPRSAPQYDPRQRMSLPVGKSPRGPLDPMAKASWGNLMDAFNRDLDAPGEKGFFLVRKCSPEHPGSVRCMLIVEDNLWVGCGSGAVRIWSMQTGQMLEDLKAHSDGIYDMKLVKDHVWTCAKDKTIHVFNIRKLRAGPVKKLVAGNNFCVCLVEVDSRVWSGHIDGEIKVWSTNHYKVKKQISEGQTIGSFLKRGNVVWIGTEDNIVVYDHQTLKPKGTLVGHKNTVNCLASVGPYEVWSCSSDQTVRCWNPDSFDCLKVLQADSKVFSLMEVRSVNLVFCGCWGKTILVWNSNTYEIVQKLESSHKDATACFSLDKHNQVWSGSWDGTVDIWRYGVLSQLQK